MNQTTEVSLETQQRIELGYLRQSMVDGSVARRIDRRHGEVSTEQIREWERDAYRRWRETYPALSQMFPSIEELSS